MKDFIKATVIKSTPRYSVVSDANGEYTYPKELVLNAEVDLKIKSIENDRVLFNTDYPFLDFENGDVFNSKILEVIEGSGDFSTVIVDLLGHVIKISFPRWLVKAGYLVVGNNVEVVLVKFYSSVRFKLKYHENIEHYKYQRNNTYEFKLERFLDKNEIIVRDISDDLGYKAKSHFAKVDLREGDIVSLRYLYLQENYTPFLAMDHRDVFLEPDKLFSKDELEYIFQKRNVNYDVFEELKSKIKDTDNFWILTCSRYLSYLSNHFLENSDYENCLKVDRIYKKISGFLEAKNFFDSIPEHTKKSILPAYELSKKTVNSQGACARILSNYGNEKKLFEQCNFEDALKLFWWFTTKNTASKSKFSLQITKECLEYLITNKQGNYNQIVAIKNTFIYKYYFKLLKQSNNLYFLNKEKKLTWLEVNNLSIYIEISKILLKNFDEILSAKETISLLTLEGISFILGTSDEVEEVFKNCTDLIIQHGLSHLIDDSSLDFDDEDCALLRGKIFLLNFKTGIYWTTNHWFIISGSNLHVVSWALENNTPVRVKRNYSTNRISLLSIEKYPEFGSESPSFERDFPVILKLRVDKTQNLFYSTYYSDKNGNSKELITRSLTPLLDGDKLDVGDTVIAREVSKDSNDNYSAKIHNDLFHIHEHQQNRSYCGIVLRKHMTDKNETCASCSKEKTIGSIYTYCSNCRIIEIEAVEVYIPEIDKKIILTKYSTKNIKWEEFFLKSIVGRKIDFRLLEGFTNLKIYREGNPHMILCSRIYFEKFGKIGVLESPEKKTFSSGIGLFLYSIIQEITLYSQENFEQLNKISKISNRLGSYFKSPKTYLSNAILSYKSFIKSLDENLLIDENFFEFKEYMLENFQKTVNYYPPFKTVLDTIEIISYLNKVDNYSDLVAYTRGDSKDNTRLAKAILIRNLIISEPGNESFLNSINNQILSLLNKSSSDLTFVGYSKAIENNPDEELFKKIEAGEVTEGQSIEFKETFQVPVLSAKELQTIKNLQSRIDTDPKNSTKFQSQIDSITNSISKNSKQIQDILAYSAIKNVAAFLNTNNGKLLIGVSDTGELKGLGKDYELLKDWDGFQQKFEIYWQKYIVDSQRFRPFLNLRLVKYNGNEFCLIEVSYPNPDTIPEPCFLLKDGEEICLVKNSSTTKKLSLRDMHRWKRKSISIKEKPNYVYLMKDRHNKTKIGMSVDPLRRHGTLQSENPGIEIFGLFIFPTRDVACDLEKAMHNKYSKFRLNNSEFFNLNDQQIEELIGTLKQYEIDLSSSLIDQKNEYVSTKSQSEILFDEKVI